MWIAKLMIQIYIEYRTGLRVVDIESLLDESIDPAVLHLLFNHGVSETLAAVTSRLDTLMANDTIRMSSPTCLDPVEAIAMNLTAFSLDQMRFAAQSDMEGGKQEEYGHTHQQLDTNNHYSDYLPTNNEPLQGDHRLDYESFAVPSLKMLPAVSHVNDWGYDANELNFNAITYQAINTLFPDSAGPATDAEFQVSSPTHNWIDPMTPPPPAQQPAQPFEMAQQQAHCPVAYEQSYLLDESFWDYVADVNHLPPEQVL